MKVIEIEQGSSEWHAMRRCKITGTKLEKVMGSPLDRVQLIAELIAEEGTEQSRITRPTEEMERGSAEEEFAIRRYEANNRKKVTRGGMWVSDVNDWHAHSPDGSLVKRNGDVLEAFEVKNPLSSTAMFYRIAAMIPNELTKLSGAKRTFLGVPQDYKWQVVNAFLVNEKLQKLHFLVHDARFINDAAKLTVTTVERSNPAMLEAIHEAAGALARFRADWLAWKEVVLPDNF